MRILLDQGLAPGAAQWLREKGWDAVHVSEIGMHAAEDVEILALARDAGRVCVTLDRDFHSHLARTGAGQPSVVLLRIQGLAALEQGAFVLSVLDQCRDAIEKGAAISANLESIRIRHLPLVIECDP